MMTICHVCGNEREVVGGCCPFCGNSPAETEAENKNRPFIHKSVNIEAGRPVVDVALHRLSQVIEDALLHKINILTIIHGYGSSGKGGAIRSECRKTLDYMKNNKLIRDYIVGENYNKRFGQVKSLLQRFPKLNSDVNLNKNNKGITLVILS